ncbi:hypothetical protein HBH92_067590 [Parastagonospora nodorum]|nr:hypothetical protein HBH92_067590 [Parastagonospora nodorum]KAH4443933.1 hypothetical protein HBH93_066470 [Parastagonospora nodorum]KAH4456812.1 hypothetical protein HBH91_097580 [Parastagonospora nodorum]KAH4493638.1 hypothetical protein HBH89_160040 [Parastagonospora nodorum]KAH4545660.1 hypothetical protein HBH85_088700 [Parastagonospora nodorum]
MLVRQSQLKHYLRTSLSFWNYSFLPHSITTMHIFPRIPKHPKHPPINIADISSPIPIPEHEHKIKMYWFYKLDDPVFELGIPPQEGKTG